MISLELYRLKGPYRQQAEVRPGSGMLRPAPGGPEETQPSEKLDKKIIV